MRLSGRVSKLEKKTSGASGIEHPSVILRTSVWQEDDGELMSEPHAAHVRTPTGWDYLAHEEGESAENFKNRIEQMTLDYRHENAPAQFRPRMRTRAIDRSSTPLCLADRPAGQACLGATPMRHGYGMFDG
ncbi:hypothetical protein TL5118_01626 [Thalassovita autumnalis]|uniref:Uncharacterized protein n=1 Tax=Thalassovita autumnalis TaxID=2072972 RepID=A0A0P1FUP2_9RHOB|nr:hypothetical protein TL5118_01626 [Thalassovita autumnalis]CUH72454.1 hypothetical protein TL5120_02254 [Thalassovita autumnalis]